MTGRSAVDAAAGSLSSPRFSARRHLNTWFAFTPCARATSATLAPGSNVSSAIRRFSDSVRQRRGRRPVPISCSSPMTASSSSNQVPCQRGTQDAYRCNAAHAEDEGRSRFGDADATIQAGHEEAAHLRQEFVGVPRISMGNLQLDSREMKHQLVQNSACFPCSPLSQRLAYLRLSEQPRIESNTDITNDWNKVGSLQRKHPHQLRQSRSAQDRHHQE